MNRRAIIKHPELNMRTLVEATAGANGFYTSDRLFVPAGARTTVTLREAKELLLSGQVVDFKRA